MFGADKGNADKQDGSKLHVAMVQARFNEGITTALAEACRAELLAPFYASPGAPAAPATRGTRAFFGVAKDHGMQTDGSVTGGSWLQSFAAVVPGEIGRAHV